MDDARITFSMDFGDGFSITRYHNIGRDAHVSASFHKLTPGQFDALLHQFGGGHVRFLTTESGKDFRTAEINLGGLEVTIFADVPATEFLPA